MNIVLFVLIISTSLFAAQATASETSPLYFINKDTFPVHVQITHNHITSSPITIGPYGQRATIITPRAATITIQSSGIGTQLISAQDVISRPWITLEPVKSTPGTPKLALKISTYAQKPS
jgi:hypothetical protein